jgi:hypothetical protein
MSNTALKPFGRVARSRRPQATIRMHQSPSVVESPDFLSPAFIGSDELTIFHFVR